MVTSTFTSDDYIIIPSAKKIIVYVSFHPTVEQKRSTISLLWSRAGRLLKLQLSEAGGWSNAGWILLSLVLFVAIMTQREKSSTKRSRAINRQSASIDGAAQRLSSQDIHATAATSQRKQIDAFAHLIIFNQYKQ